MLAPWRDLDPHAELPGHGPIVDLLAELPLDGVRRRSDPHPATAVMTPTRVRVLVLVAVVVGALAFGISRLVSEFTAMPGVPTSAPITIFCIAVLMFATALGLRTRIRAQHRGVLPAGERSPKPLNPLQAARAAVLGKAGALVGSLVVGAYAGYGAFLALDLTIAVRRDHAISCGWAVLAGVLLVLAALFLEHVFRPTTGRGAATAAPTSRPAGRRAADACV